MRSRADIRPDTTDDELKVVAMEWINEGSEFGLDIPEDAVLDYLRQQRAIARQHQHADPGSRHR